MPIFHCQAKAVSRSSGRSAPGAAAYRAGEKVKDERTGELHDYTRKEGVEHAELVLPSGVVMSREELWNAAERAEKRKDAKVAREWEIALPAEVSSAERLALALDFAKCLVDRYGVAADVAIHAPSRKGDERNVHAHILTTTRQATPEGLAAKTRVLDCPKTSGQEVEKMRALWAEMVNRALERAGSQERVSPKTLKEQGIEREPTRHLGPAATAMQRRRAARVEKGIDAAKERLLQEKAARAADKAEAEKKAQQVEKAIAAAKDRMQQEKAARAEAEKKREEVKWLFYKVARGRTRERDELLAEWDAATPAHRKRLEQEAEELVKALERTHTRSKSRGR